MLCGHAPFGASNVVGLSIRPRAEGATAFGQSINILMTVAAELPRKTKRWRERGRERAEGAGKKEANRIPFHIVPYVVNPCVAIFASLSKDARHKSAVKCPQRQ